MAVRRSRKLAMAETREALILAGLAEFAELGFDVPSLDRICARAGFTRGAFYVHFANREDFIVAVMESRLGAFFDAVIGTGDTEMGLEPTVRRFVEAIREETRGAPGNGPVAADGDAAQAIQLHRLLDASERSELIRNRLQALLQSAVQRVAEVSVTEQAAHSVREDIDPQVIGSLLVALALGTSTAVEAGLPIEWERVGDAVIRLLRP